MSMRPGRGDADGGDVVQREVRGGDGPADRLAHRLQAGVLPAFGAVSRTTGSDERLAGVVHDRGLHRGPADVQPDEIPVPPP